MSDALIGVMLTQGVILVLAVAGFVQRRNQAKAIQEVHLSVNSRLTELIKAVKISSHAEGRLEGMAEKKRDERKDI
jgi:hypothetical protein